MKKKKKVTLEWREAMIAMNILLWASTKKELQGESKGKIIHWANMAKLIARSIDRQT